MDNKYKTYDQVLLQADELLTSLELINKLDKNAFSKSVTTGLINTRGLLFQNRQDNFLEYVKDKISNRTIYPIEHVYVNAFGFNITTYDRLLFIKIFKEEPIKFKLNEVNYELFDNLFEEVNEKMIKINGDVTKYIEDGANNCIKDFCKSQNIKSTCLKYDEDIHGYDFREGTFGKSLGIPLSKQFKTDFIETINTIKYLYKNPPNRDCHLHLDAGNRYFYKLVCMNDIEDGLYTIYDTRMGDTTKFVAYKNGRKLGIRGTRRIVKQYIETFKEDNTCNQQ
jgi:hypothetical protein